MRGALWPCRKRTYSIWWLSWGPPCPAPATRLRASSTSPIKIDKSSSSANPQASRPSNTFPATVGGPSGSGTSGRGNGSGFSVGKLGSTRAASSGPAKESSTLLHVPSLPPCPPHEATVEEFGGKQAIQTWRAGLWVGPPFGWKLSRGQKDLVLVERARCKGRWRAIDKRRSEKENWMVGTVRKRMAGKNFSILWSNMLDFSLRKNIESVRKFSSA